MRIRFLLVAIWVSSAIASSPTIDPDPDSNPDLSRHKEDETTKDSVDLSTATSVPKCNCKGGPAECPLNGNCLQNDVVYEAVAGICSKCLGSPG